MATITCPCPKCDRQMVVQIGQYADSRKLVWNRGSRCLSCSFAWKKMPGGFPPDDIRKLLIAENGTWNLYVETAMPERARVASTMRTALNLSLKDGVQILKSIPGKLYMGTRPEVQWLANVMGQLSADVIVRIERSEP